MKREFNENQRYELALYARQGVDEAGYYHEMITDWLRDNQYLAPSNLGSSAKSYYEGVQKTLNKAGEDVNAIYDAAEAVEKEYAAKFEDIAFEMSLFADRITALRDVLRPPSLTMTGSTLTSDDFAVRLATAKTELLNKEILCFIADPDKLERLNFDNLDAQAYIDLIGAKYRGQDMFDAGSPNHISDVELKLLIGCYEVLHPEDAKNMNDFLKPLIKDGNYDNDVQNIKYLSYAAEEPYRSLLLANISKISIWNYKSEESKVFEDQGFCIPIFKSILMSLKNDGLTDPRGAYNTVFHEIGHGIDDAAKGWGYKTASYIDPVFKMSMNDIVKGEVITHIEGTIASLAASSVYSYTEKDKADVLSALLYKGKLDSNKSNNPDYDAQLDLYNEVTDKYQNDFKWIYGNQKKDFGPYCVVTDMFAAFVASNDNKSIIGGFAHNTNYWHGISPFGIGLVGGEFVGMEFFAGYYSACVTGDTAQCDIIRQYFKNTCRAMDRMIDEIADSIETESR